MASLARPGRSWPSRLRELRIIAGAALDESRPVPVQIIPIRRCKLACGYCKEFEHRSPPVRTEVMPERIDLLARMGTAVVAISGGEPLLHPELEALIRPSTMPSEDGLVHDCSRRRGAPAIPLASS